MYLDSCTINDAFDVRTEGGNIVATNVNFPASSFIRSARGSVYIIDTKNPDRDYTINYRQPGNAVCVQGGDVDSLALREPWDPEPDAALRRLTVNQFDENKDFFVTTDEFASGLTDIGRCCGGGCPFWTWCASLQFRVFPSESSSDENTAGSNSIAGRSGIVTDTVFMDRLMEFTNETSLVPFYYRPIVATSVDSGANTRTLTVRACSQRPISCPVKKLCISLTFGFLYTHLQIEANEGQIRAFVVPFPTDNLNLDANDFVVAPGSLTLEGVVPAYTSSLERMNYTYVSLPDVNDGIRMLKRDADRMVDELQVRLL